jgi:hypothetical protein
MSQPWLIYTTASRSVAEEAVESMYVTLGLVVGEDLAEHLDPGEELEPPTLGSWPDVSVLEKAPVPTSDEARASLAGSGKAKAKLDEAALTRLATCKSTIQIDQATAFDPSHVSALRALFESLGPSVFTKGAGLELSTSESLLATLAGAADLAESLRAIAAGKADDDDDDEDEDDEDDDDDLDEDDDEPAPDSAKPEMLRMMLGEIAQLPRVRRKAAELLGGAPPLVGQFAERLARVGAEPDLAAAKALGVEEREVIGARKALANLLRRAESR